MGNLIKHKMIDLGIKNKELASITGLSEKYISDLVCGRIDNPSRKRMIAISKALNTPVQELFFNED